ncbi:MAG: BsaA family SipW-dependent biofilm matrix protein [Coriobacteriia bacterium]|nr:BsaA family SipW-dependent biofilm matrix protein [Coriobacteriia bacterium]
MRKIKKSLPLFGMIALVVAIAIGGTFAYFSQTGTAENYLTTMTYDSTITEDFTPPADGAFAPDVEIDKEVGVTNTGEIPFLVRIKYEEAWNGTPVSLTYADAVNTPSGSEVWIYDGDTEDDSVVKKIKYGETAGWTYGGDGYYYYLAELDPGQTAPSFIDSIMLKASTVNEDTSWVLTWWDGTAADYVDETFTSQGAVDDRKAAIMLMEDGSYLVNVIENTKTTLDMEGGYTLTFTMETVQAIEEGADSWTTPTVTDVITFLGGVL